MQPDMFVDHHLQSTVVETLKEHGETVFSYLKPASVENSLFMYHVRKLITRGIVEKSHGGFRLTPDGARWANRTNLAEQYRPTPRALIQFIVVKDTTVLISERVEHMATHLNRYMLPGGLHRFGETSDESAKRIAAQLGLHISGPCIGHSELIDQAKGHHSLVDLYLAECIADPASIDDVFYSMRFMPLDDACRLPVEIANATAEILQAYRNGTLTVVTKRLS